VRLSSLRIAIVTSGLLALPLGAQVCSPAALDITLGLHAVTGGFIDFRTGALLDVLATGRIRAASRRAIVAGGGASTVVGGFGDRCLLTPSGGCAGKGNFVVVNALVGIDQALGAASGRLLIGPALYDGAKARSVGVQARVDLTSPVRAHLALGAMGRVTLLPSHNGQTLIGWAAGARLAFR
jgi:hypothetical protein